MKHQRNIQSELHGSKRVLIRNAKQSFVMSSVCIKPSAAYSQSGPVIYFSRVRRGTEIELARAERPRSVVTSVGQNTVNVAVQRTKGNEFLSVWAICSVPYTAAFKFTVQMSRYLCKKKKNVSSITKFYRYNNNRLYLFYYVYYIIIYVDVTQSRLTKKTWNY